MLFSNRGIAGGSLAEYLPDSADGTLRVWNSPGIASTADTRRTVRSGGQSLTVLVGDMVTRQGRVLGALDCIRAQPGHRLRNDQRLDCLTGPQQLNRLVELLQPKAVGDEPVEAQPVLRQKRDRQRERATGDVDA